MGWRRIVYSGFRHCGEYDLVKRSAEHCYRQGWRDEDYTVDREDAKYWEWFARRGGSRSIRNEGQNRRVAVRMECRGLVMDQSGRVIVRPVHKSFGVGQMRRLGLGRQRV